MNKSPIQTLYNEDFKDDRSIANTLYNAVLADNFVTIYCRCTIDYDGRATSRIEEGDRLIIIKADGTCLIHSDEGQKPVNWQPPGAETELEYNTNIHVISERSSPQEQLDIEISTFYKATVFSIDDTASLLLQGTENEMHEHIMNHPEIIEDGFSPIENERQTDYGAIDIFGRDTDNCPVIIEVKRRKSNLKQVDQLKRYVEEYENEHNHRPRGILVGPSASKNAYEKISENELEFIELEPLDVV